MIFENTNEAFNYWNKRSKAEIEQRSVEIQGLIDNDPSADVATLNLEFAGLREAFLNKQEQEQTAEPDSEETTRSLTPLSSFNVASSNVQVEQRAVDSPIYRNAFFKNLLGRSLNTRERAVFNQAQQEFRKDTFNSSTDSSAVLPTETLNEVISKARKEGGLMAVARAFNVPSNISIPVGTPHSMAKWNDEGQDVEREKANVETVEFDGYEIIKVFSVSNKVKTMSIPAFESYLTEELSSCVMATLADGLVNGTGVKQGLGLLTGITWNKSNSFKTNSSKVEYTDITRLVSMLKRGYSNGAVFVMNNVTLYRNIFGIVDNNKRPIFVVDPKVENIGTLLGFPVVIDDFIPDNVILFGNPYYDGYNLPQGITIESSTQSSFTSGRIDYRAMAIADCKPIIKEAFVLMQIKNVAEEIVKLSTSEETQPETVEGVSATITVKNNQAIIQYTGLTGQAISYQILDSKNAVIAEMKDRTFTSEKTADSITLTFFTDMPEDTYTLNAKVIDQKKYKTIEQVKLTLKQDPEQPITTLHGTPIVIGQ